MSDQDAQCAVVERIYRLGAERRWRETLPLFTPDAVYGDLRTSYLPFDGLTVAADPVYDGYVAAVADRPRIRWRDVVTAFENGLFYASFPNFAWHRVGPLIAQPHQDGTVIVFMSWVSVPTFDGVPYRGIRPTGRPLALNGLDGFLFRPGTTLVSTYQSYANPYQQILDQSGPVD